MKKFLTFLPFCCLLALPLTAAAQTFQINGGSAQPQAAAPQGQKGKRSSDVSRSEEGFGWGNSIEVGRNARAAEAAMKKGNWGAASSFAQRAVNAAPGNAKLWFLLGYTSRMAGRYPVAVQAYNRGLQVAPKSIDGLSGLAQTYMKMGNIAEAQKLVDRVLASNPKRPDDLMMGAELALRAKQPQRALQFLQRAESLKPSARGEVMLASTYMRMGQPQKAKQLLDQAKRRDPRNVDIFRAVAAYYRESKDYKSAIATLKQAPRQTPALLADLAYSYQLNGDYKQAAGTYATAAAKDPTNIGLQLNAAQSYISAGEPETAKQYVAKAQAIDANYYRLHAIRGLLARDENRYEDAIREYNTALANVPTGGVNEGPLYPVLLRLNLAELYRMANNQAAAQQQIATAQRQMAAIPNISATDQAEFLRVRASVRAAGDDFKGAEADLTQALKLDPTAVNTRLQFANLMWREKRPKEAENIYNAVLREEPNNKPALESMGYLMRETGDAAASEKFFRRVMQADPADYVPYLALGDMYTARKDFTRGLDMYEQAFKRAPQNPAVISSGANACIEAHRIKEAGEWLARAKGPMLDDARIMRETQRYLFHEGKYRESASLGQKVVAKLPQDPRATVYYAYALYNLGRYDDVLSFADRYQRILPTIADFPLLAGHVHKQYDLLDQAVSDYTRALQVDPHMVNALLARGYVRNDEQQAGQAVEDFQAVLKQDPKNGIAQLGMGFSNLQLHRPAPALQEINAAEKSLGENNGPTHMARAEAFRQLHRFNQAIDEYHVALKYAPQDLKLHMALASSLYDMRRYMDAIGEWNQTLRLSPGDPAIYGEIAHAYAHMKDRNNTLRYVQLAEAAGGEQSAVLLDTADALLTLGDFDGAMGRYARALQAPDADRVQARLGIAKAFVERGKWDDAKQQIALAFAEARIGEASPVTSDNLVDAAALFLHMNDFDLAQRYFVKAKEMGAPDDSVAIGLANVYLAEGKSLDAQNELASLGSPSDYSDNYDYMLAMGESYRQQHDNLRAMSAFAHANTLAYDDTVAERAMLETAGDQGITVGHGFSLLSDFSMAPIYDDATIYTIDAQLLGATSGPGMPPPRSSLETKATTAFRYNRPGLPPILGFVQYRNAHGQISLPSEAKIVNRNTNDFSFRGGLAPTVNLGAAKFHFNTGVQFTLRRDTRDPFDMNQNLFRQFVYMDSNALWNWFTIRGEAFHEAGPFTMRPLHSRELGAGLEFAVGHPWAHTAFVTGYSVRDVLFRPLIREFFTTSTWAGVEHKFGTRADVTFKGEYIRAWRVQDASFAIAQAVRPAVDFNFQATPRWAVNGNFAYDRGEGFHGYDNMQSGFFISYQQPLRRTWNDGSSDLPVEYPLQFSVGIQQDNFMNFAGRGQTMWKPVVRLTLF